jgi:hypothetical protein
LRDLGERRSPNKRACGPSRVVISGDTLGSRILALLLQDSSYQAKFCALASLNEPGVLEDVQLLVLTPTHEALGPEDRKALLASLKEMTREMELTVIELVSLSEERREEEAQELATHKVFWPCNIDKLERQIEAVLSPCSW